MQKCGLTITVDSGLCIGKGKSNLKEFGGNMFLNWKRS